MATQRRCNEPFDPRRIKEDIRSTLEPEPASDASNKEERGDWSQEDSDGPTEGHMSYLGWCLESNSLFVSIYAGLNSVHMLTRPGAVQLKCLAAGRETERLPDINGVGGKS